MTPRAKRRLLIWLTACLTGLAVPGWAGEVTVDAVIAAQYDFGFFIALVYAHGTEELIDAQLVVDDRPIVADKEEKFVLDASKNITLFKIVKYTQDSAEPGLLGRSGQGHPRPGRPLVVTPDDTLTAIITDKAGDSGMGTAACAAARAAGRLTTICK